MTDVQTTRPSERPPLRILHLLLWTTATAVLIAGCMWFDRTMRNGPPIESKIVIASLTLGAIAITGALTFTFLGIYWSDHGYPFPNGPGEILLWIVAHTTIAIVAFLGIFVAFAIGDDLLSIYYPVVGLLLLIYWVWTNARGISRYADTTAWRCVFVSLMLTTPASPLLLGVAQPTAWPMVLFLLCLLWAAGDDLRRKVSRGWIHWLGVTLAFAVACALIGKFDVPKLFR